MSTCASSRDKRIERHPDGDRVIGGGRPVDVDVVALRGDHQHGAVDERAGDPAEQVDHQLVGPLHVVEPHDDRAVLRPAAQAFDDDGEQASRALWPGPSHRTSTGVPSGAAPSRRTGRAPGRPRRSGSTRHPSAGSSRGARRSVPPGRGSSGGTARWRSAPTRCSRRTGAQIPANTTAERLGNVCSISLTSRVLPDPASPVTATTALRPLATIDMTDDSSSRWLARPTKGTSVRTPIDGTRRSSPGDLPDPFGLLAARPRRCRRRTRARSRRRPTRRSSRRCRPLRAAPSSAAETPRSRRRPSPCTPRCRRRYRRRPRRCSHRSAGAAARRCRAWLVDELFEGVVELERGPNRTVGIVLVRDRRTEQGQDGIAEHLVDRAAERLDVDDEPLEGGDRSIASDVRGRGVPTGSNSRRCRRTAPSRPAVPRSPTATTSCPQNGQKRAPSGSERKHDEHVPLAGIRR